MELASDEVLKLSIRRGVYKSQAVNMRVDARATLILADNKRKVEYEFVVAIEFEKEVWCGRRLSVLPI